MKKIIPLLIIPLIFFPLFFPLKTIAVEIVDGDLIRVQSTLDVYIVKLIPSTSSGQVVEKKFKRLILNPEIFNKYGHLKWENIKEVSQTEIENYTTSDLVRAVGDEKVYALVSELSFDTGQKKWIKTADDFINLGYDWDSVYTINEFERDAYTIGQDLTAPATPIQEPIQEPTTPLRSPITINVPADYSTIQAAIDVAITGDTISVATGTYNENITINKNIKLIGKYANSVIIDGQGNGPGISIQGSDDFLIQKFTIKSQNQKAIYCSSVDLSKGIIKNIILKDSDWGIYIEDNCDLTILNNIIYNNRNSTNKDGGGILVKNNDSYSFTLEIRNNTIDDNHHGVFIENSKVKIINSIISSNMGSTQSAGIYRKNSIVSSTYNDVWGNGQDYVGKVPIGDGSISYDPRFVDTKQRDYRLIRGSDNNSPCIDVGSPNTAYNDGKLFSSSYERSDMGAYGGPDNIGWDL